MLAPANEMITLCRLKNIVAAEVSRKCRSLGTYLQERNGKVCTQMLWCEYGLREFGRYRRAVSVIAAQSIGEPGTQLTMRTLPYRRCCGGDITSVSPVLEELFEARKPRGQAVITEISEVWFQFRIARRNAK